jgi:hypothetical protein
LRRAAGQSGAETVEPFDPTPKFPLIRECGDGRLSLLTESGAGKSREYDPGEKSSEPNSRKISSFQD